MTLGRLVSRSRKHTVSPQAGCLTCFQSNCSYSRWLSVNSLSIWTPSHAQKVRLDSRRGRPFLHDSCHPPKNKINSSSCLCVKEWEWSRAGVWKLVKPARKDLTSPRRTIPCHAERARGVKKVSASFDPPEARTDTRKASFRPLSACVVHGQWCVHSHHVKSAMDK